MDISDLRRRSGRRLQPAMGRSSGMGRRGAVLLALVLACSLLVSPIAAEEAAGAPSDVLVLDISNFTENVKKYDFLVVEFYAPWCGHCKSLAPQYEKAATALRANDPPITLAKVDLNEEENKPLASEFKVEGFPTLKVIRHKGATVTDYKGPRDADGIISHLIKLGGPPSLEVTSAAQGEKVLADGEQEIVIVGVFKSLDGEDYANFIETADGLRGEFVFAHTVDASYIPDNGVPLKVPSVRLHKDFDDKIADTTDFTVEGLKGFYKGESLPLITEMSKKPEHRSALMRFFESSKDKVFFFVERPETSDDEDEVEVEDESADAASLSSFAKNAKAFKEKGLLFLFTRAQDSANALEYFGLSESQLPAYVIQTDGGKKYIQTDFKPEQLGPWLDEYLAGKLVEHVKSEPIPITNDEPVKVIVAKSFNQEVLESGKDVFLEFYAPWCGHCKKLAPVLDEVALSYESDPNVVIAKFDATANDVPADLFDVKGFPTLYLHTAGGDVIPFESDRTKETIMQFIDFHRAQAGNSDDAGIPDISTEVPLETVTTGVKDEL